MKQGFWRQRGVPHIHALTASEILGSQAGDIDARYSAASQGDQFRGLSTYFGFGLAKIRAWTAFYSGRTFIQDLFSKNSPAFAAIYGTATSRGEGAGLVSTYSTEVPHLLASGPPIHNARALPNVRRLTPRPFRERRGDIMRRAMIKSGGHSASVDGAPELLKFTINCCSKCPKIRGRHALITKVKAAMEHAHEPAITLSVPIRRRSPKPAKNWNDAH